MNRLKQWDDQKSWQEFFDIYHRLIFGAAIKAGLNETEADDVVQETVLAVAKALPKFEYRPEKCSFKTWLHSITKRKVADQFRNRLGKGRQWEHVSSGMHEQAEVNEIPDPAGEALDEMWEREWEKNLLEAARERLKRRVSPAQFQIYEYLVIQGHTVIETARALGISPARVYVTKHRLSKQERKELAGLKSKYV